MLGQNRECMRDGIRGEMRHSEGRELCEMGTEQKSKNYGQEGIVAECGIVGGIIELREGGIVAE